jgi:hypothetical protein
MLGGGNLKVPKISSWFEISGGQQFGHLIFLSMSEKRSIALINYTFSTGITLLIDSFN